MKTKYILHGGYADLENEDNNKFFREILSVDKKELNILLVLFAKKDKEYRVKGKAVADQFNLNNIDNIQRKDAMLNK